MVIALVMGCGAGPGGKAGPSTVPTAADAVADVTAVSVSGDAGNYTFAVTIESDETGCDQYADWWEVLTDGGDLVYRRILNHSHPDEQPFTRTGGPVEVDASDALFIRAHLNPAGYTGRIATGSVESGFEIIAPEPGFASGLSKNPPLPGDCWF